MSLTINSKLEGTLFNVAQEKRREKGPVMEGEFQITGESGKIKGAAWSKTSDKDKSVRYLSVQIEISRDLKFYGAIFATKEKRSDSSPDYYGTLNLTKAQRGPELRIAGWKRKGKDTGVPFISVVIEPPRLKDAAGTTQQADPFEHASNDLPI